MRTLSGPDSLNLVGNWAVARNLRRVPHPYEDGMAEEWIGKLAGGFEDGWAYVFAVERRADDAFMGLVGIERNERGQHDLGYWLGQPFWGQGYMSEAVPRAVRYAFEAGDADRVVATALPGNAASLAILRGLGMTDEGPDVIDWPVENTRREVIRFSLDRADFDVGE